MAADDTPCSSGVLRGSLWEGVSADRATDASDTRKEAAIRRRETFMGGRGRCGQKRGSLEVRAKSPGIKGCTGPRHNYPININVLNCRKYVIADLGSN